MKEAGLYLHIPFCRSKCGYCAFNSIAARRSETDAYLELLARQITSYAALPWSRAHIFTTLFIGGGTPSLASPGQLADLIALCSRHFTMADGAEISMEANPDTIDPAGLTTLRQAGVNRLSIGVQSFNNDILATLNRAHDGKQAVQAVTTARKSGFTNINIDLIYGLPGQTLATWQADLDQALNLHPEHLALYELSVEPATPFALLLAKGALVLPDEDLVADMEQTTASRLASSPLQRYEISNYAQPDRQCRHNIHYWQNGSYLGLGAGAVSCLDGLRLSQEDDPHLYIDLVKKDKPTISHAECLSRKGRFRETMIMGLRLLNGVDLDSLERRYQLTAHQVYGTLLIELTEQGWLQRRGNMLSLAPHCLAVANQVLTKLV